MTRDWRSIAEQKQRERESRIPPAWRLDRIDQSSKSVLSVPRQCGLLDENELRITEEPDATALLRKLADGTYTSLDVVTAFCKRAAIAQQLTNCLTEIFFHDAIKRAKYLDEAFLRTGKPIGPLHGLPISLKDVFNVKGYDASIGIASLCFKPATANSALVEQLLSLGAVLYVKTNVPQTLMALDSHNNVFGRTLNPANRLLTPGGSSGGEGALIALRGSVLGIGTDVGGSIRIPAMCNGLFGVKPSHGRVPYAGLEGGGLPGNNRLTMEATAGPIAHSIRDCHMLLRVVSDSAPWASDPDVLPQGWEGQVSLQSGRLVQQPARPLLVGVAKSDGYAVPHPPIARLMDEVMRVLQDRSASPPPAVEIQVVELDISPLWSRCLKLFNALQSTEGANHAFDLLEDTGEPLSPWLQGRLRRRPQKSLDASRALLAQKSELQALALSIWSEDGGYWRTTKQTGTQGGTRSPRHQRRRLDVFLCPVAPHPVLPVDRWNTVNYTGAFNLLDLPAGVLPVRPFAAADKAGEFPDDDDAATTAPLNGWDRVNRELWTRADRDVYVGSSLGVQVVAPRLQERKLLECMALLEVALRPLAAGSERRVSRL
ncbi:amidase [Polychaeton citri CBS 116435]|uniref:amidase n=1 Tax=Polychaeton citri CBS 116435 TaxID=1314669 RepID=A0A9P4UL32_9PEZI|nr:amidase [Polychaeton citri CBS 116435]